MSRFRQKATATVRGGDGPSGLSRRTRAFRCGWTPFLVSLSDSTADNPSYFGDCANREGRRQLVRARSVR